MPFLRVCCSLYVGLIPRDRGGECVIAGCRLHAEGLFEAFCVHDERLFEFVHHFYRFADCGRKKTGNPEHRGANRATA